MYDFPVGCASRKKHGRHQYEQRSERRTVAIPRTSNWFRNFKLVEYVSEESSWCPGYDGEEGADALTSDQGDGRRLHVLNYWLRQYRVRGASAPVDAATHPEFEVWRLVLRAVERGEEGFTQAYADREFREACERVQPHVTNSPRVVRPGEVVTNAAPYYWPAEARRIIVGEDQP